MVTRRNFLKGLAAGGAAIVVPGALTRTAGALVPAGALPFTRPLPVPPFVDLTAGGSIALEMTNGVHDYYSGSNTPVYRYRIADAGYAGAQPTVLGPTLVARRGAPVSVTVTNSLGTHPVADAIDTGIPGATTADRAAARAVVHLHGGHTAEAFDGGPDDVIANGTSFTYEYGNLQESGTIWYHDHALGITRLNVYAGLAGGYLIRDSDDDGSGTTLPAPPYEIPLILQDRMFNADGTLAYPPGPLRAWAPEFFGDVATVNGEAWPNLDVEQGRYRFRIVNGSQSRFYVLKIVAPGGLAQTFHQIGTDGGLLDAPVRMNSLLVGPGERADVVVDFAPFPVGTKIVMTNSAKTPFPDGPRSARRGGVPLPSIMQFTVTAATASTFTAPLPATLRAVPVTPLAGNTVAAVRTMALLEVLDAAGNPVMALLNDRPFYSEDVTPDPAYQQIEHRADTLEQWNLVNLTVDAHPIHLHLPQFQVLNRQKLDAAGYLAAAYPGLPLSPFQTTYPATATSPAPDPATFLRGGTRPPPANERGWKDTVVVLPGEVTRILVPLGANAVPGFPMAVDAPPGGHYTGDYVWHCHILEHEENDMMQHYRVV